MWRAPDSDDIPNYIWVSYRLPDVGEYRRSFRGALFELVYPGHWEGSANVTPGRAVEVMTDVFNSVRRGALLPIGSVLFAGFSATPTGFLECDGASYDKAVYPALFSAIGYTFGGSGDNFNVPNLKGRFAVGLAALPDSYALNIGDTGGEQNHTLTEDEMPIHNHGSHDHTTIPFINGLETPESKLLSVPGNTGNAGDSQPHNNLPPYLTLKPFIVSE